MLKLFIIMLSLIHSKTIFSFSLSRLCKHKFFKNTALFSSNTKQRTIQDQITTSSLAAAATVAAAAVNAAVGMKTLDAPG